MLSLIAVNFADRCQVKVCGFQTRVLLTHTERKEDFDTQHSYRHRGTYELVVNRMEHLDAAHGSKSLDLFGWSFPSSVVVSPLDSLLLHLFPPISIVHPLSTY
jgi:hypothetical protein